MSKEKTEEPRATKELLCVGIAEVANSEKLLPKFVEVLDAGVADFKRTYCWNVKATVGHVYAVEVIDWTEEAKVIAKTTWGWRGRWEDRAAALVWEAEAATLRANRERAKAQKRAEKTTAMREAISPLSKAYRKLISTADRRAFLAMVVAEIVTYEGD